MLKQLLQNTVFAGATKRIGLLIGLVSVAITSRLLGPEGRSYLAVVGGMMGTVATLGNLSPGQVALSHGSARTDDDWLPTSGGVLLVIASVVSAIAVLGIGLAAMLGFGRTIAGVPSWY